MWGSEEGHGAVAAAWWCSRLPGTTRSRGVRKQDDASFRLWTRWTVMTLGAFYVGNGLWLLLA